MSFSGTIGTGTGSKSLQELSTGELVEGLSRKQNPATSFFDLEEPQQRSALSHLFDKYRWDQQLKQSLDFHERRCPAADATICMSWASGRRIRNPDDYIDPEDAEGLEGDDSDDEFPIGPCPPDNGYLLKARMVNQWKYVSFQSDDADDPWSVEARWTMMDLWRESRHAPMKVCSPNMPEGKNCAALCDKHYLYKRSRPHAISSQLLLYRLTSVFGSPPPMDPKETYKLCWNADFQHEDDPESGFSLYDYKGAASCKYWGTDKTSDTALELLSWLVSDNVPHTYDGCLAGAVA